MAIAVPGWLVAGARGDGCGDLRCLFAAWQGCVPRCPPPLLANTLVPRASPCSPLRATTAFAPPRLGCTHMPAGAFAHGAVPRCLYTQRPRPTVIRDPTVSSHAEMAVWARGAGCAALAASCRSVILHSFGQMPYDECIAECQSVLGSQPVMQARHEAGCGASEPDSGRCRATTLER